MYATVQQMTDRFGANLLVALTDRAAVATGLIDSAIVEKALNDASEVIDGYLASKYVLPLATTPGIVADLCQSIAIYKLHITQPDEKIVRDHQDGLKALRDILDGRLRVPVAASFSPMKDQNWAARCSSSWKRLPDNQVSTGCVL